jgi:ATP-dependent exoDNAse (exonuclease V) beta subunit
MSALTAYSASAGSGKTFRITREYLKLLLRNPEASTAYRGVLAVTFTNKATEEMKGRIIAELDGLARGDKGKLQALCEELQEEGAPTQPQALQLHAQSTLRSLLHDYSRFAVLTIDKFFQKTLHAFSHDIGLHPGFSIELDWQRLLDEAVDAIMENAEGDRKRQQWLAQLLEERIGAGHSWNIKKPLRELGEEIFKEPFTEWRSAMSSCPDSKAFLWQYRRQLAELKRRVDGEQRGLAAQALAYMAAQGLRREDFPYGKAGFINHFSKMKEGVYEPSARAAAAIGNPDCWHAKKATDQEKATASAAYAALNPLLEAAVEQWRSSAVDYRTAEVILQKLMVLGLLADIADKVRALAKQDNLMLISDSVHFIRSLIGGSDAPFIYEKMGVRYHHLMVDEFQDTSRGQWRNLLPLVRNSLSEGGRCMVVGDVKQSIYRWRSGDWSILAHRIDSDLKPFGVRRRQLADNYRSLPQLVAFNNELFSRLALRLQEALTATLPPTLPPDAREALSTLITDAYQGCAQTPKKKAQGDREGYVRVAFVPEEGGEAEAESPTIAALTRIVAEVLAQGYAASDLAILTRTNRQGQQVAEALVRGGYAVVSQEALLLRSSPAVQLVIGLLRTAAGQQGTVNLAFARSELVRYLRGEEPENLHDLFTAPPDGEEQDFLARLPLLPLPEAFEAIAQRYRLGELPGELPFLLGLHDLALEFAHRKLADIASFLAWWDERGSAKALQTPAGQNAITIATIHKAKGLQYKVVVVPFAGFALDTRPGSTLWMPPEAAPFSELATAPVPYSHKLADTIFAAQQRQEQAQAAIDALNLLYVALTRAEEQLYVLAPTPTAATAELRSMAEALRAVLPNPTGDGDTWEFGSPAPAAHPAPTGGEATIALPTSLYPAVPFALPQLHIPEMPCQP